MSLLSRIQSGLKAFVQDIGGNSLMTTLYHLFRPGEIIEMNDNPGAYIKHGYYKNPNLATVVDLIAVNAASIDIDLFEIDSEGDEIQITNHEILDVLAQPNEFISQKGFIEVLVKFDRLTGNSYIYSPRPESGNNKGRIPQDENGNFQLHYIPSPLVEIISGGPLDPVHGYTLSGRWGMKLDKFDILHLKVPSVSSDPRDQLYGESPVKTIRGTIAISNSANTAQFASFKNGGAHGLLTFKGASGTEENAAKLKADFAAEAEGETKIGKVIATSADVEFVDMGRTNVELGILESERESLRKTAAHFHIDPLLIGDPKGSTFNNQKEARKAAYTDAYIPVLETILQGLNRWLTPWYAMEGKRLELRPRISNIPEMQPDKARQWQWLNLSGGNLTPNEKRIISGVEPSVDPLMDLHYFPGNLFPLSNEDITDEEVAKFLDENNIQDYK